MITVTFTEQELAALVGLLDQGLRAVGLSAARDAVAIIAKLEAAKLASMQAAEQLG